MITERQSKFREQYVGQISPWYHGLIHIGVMYGAGLSALWWCMHQLHNPSWEWWLIIPIAIVGNFAEWAMHLHIMHRLKDVFALRAIYDRHTRQHHQYFTDNDFTIGSIREFRIVFFPWRVLLVLSVASAILGWLVSLFLGSDAGYMIPITMIGHYMLYESFHFCCHVPENAFVRHCPIINSVRRHHSVHHNMGVMMHINMNLTFPLADWVMFRHVREGAGNGATAVINLGGFANFTVLPPGGPERICAGDICACNHELDQLARGRLGAAFDRDGAAAMAGRADAVLAAELEAICGAQARGGRSLGTGDEVQRWIDRALGSELSGPDVCATACGAIGAVIGRAVAGAAGGAGSGAGLGAVLLFGGGARNAAVAGAIGRVVGEAGGRVRAGESTGVGAGEREALAMAVLGALCQDRVAITLPQVTGLPAGVAAPVAGVWTYG